MIPGSGDGLALSEILGLARRQQLAYPALPARPRDRSQKPKDAGGLRSGCKVTQLRKMTEVFFDRTKEIVHDDRNLMKLRQQ